MQEQDRPSGERIVLHADRGDGGDWIKAGRWDIPASNIHELREWLMAQQMNPSTFKELPVYRAHVDEMPWLRELEEER
jgi:hypothetical protein